ncbi:unnamed protein product [Candidula unifasciata]|uniref:BMP-binding endothelial regulator protein n=1 Tax=Candidula unifasciata TaxID=100452 RepID=A0A8S3ZDP0_9EUPU|nr:unnamed protein product [Candidula unifasciata]
MKHFTKLFLALATGLYYLCHCYNKQDHTKNVVQALLVRVARVARSCCPSWPRLVAFALNRQLCCYHDGIEYLDSEVFSLKQNPGIQCVCKQGNTTCSKRLCPVLNCPEEKIYFDGTDKCPKCKGQRMVFDTPRSCFFAKRVFASGERHVLDNCTSCVCVQGTMICDRQQCPELACSPKDQIIMTGMCCPTCKKRLSCPVANETMKHEQTWQRDKCTTCTCRDGAVRCAPKWCPHTSICPDDYRLRYREHHCCPVCTRSKFTDHYDGICTLHGQRSDVIGTFDGKTYNIDGFCTHDLIRDCAHGHLTVKVKYKTKSGVQKHIDIVTIRFGSTSIKLYKSSEIRINRTNLFSNHFNSNNFSLKIQPSQIIVKVKAGIHVNWNLNDRLSIKISGSYFQTGSLCGLCGDFDGDESNDLVNKKGHMVEDASLMAFTWVRGKLCKQHLPETDRGSSVGKKHFSIRYPYHKSRLAVKFGHQKQIDLLGFSQAGPSKTSRQFEGGRLNNNLNNTNDTSLNYTSSLNDSSALEDSSPPAISNFSEVNMDNGETHFSVDIESDIENNITERTVAAEYNTSAEDKTTLYPTACYINSLEWMKARDKCHRISSLQLNNCSSGFHNADFIR